MNRAMATKQALKLPDELIDNRFWDLKLVKDLYRASRRKLYDRRQ